MILYMYIHISLETKHRMARLIRLIAALPQGAPASRRCGRQFAACPSPAAGPGRTRGPRGSRGPRGPKKWWVIKWECFVGFRGISWLFNDV